MFLQPPPPVDRPRPWWQNNELTTTLRAVEPSDVTEKQMNGRFPAPADGAASIADPNQSDTDQSRTGSSSNNGTPTSTTIKPAEQNTQQAINLQQRPSTGPSSKSNNASFTLTSVPGHKKGVIIASASVSPGRGGRPFSNGRSSYSTHGQQKQFRSLGAASSSASSSLSASPSTFSPDYLMGASRQSAQLVMIYTFERTMSLLQYLLPTIASAILVLIYNQSNTQIAFASIKSL